ncbi:MAG: ATP-binding protein [Acidimicrobiales bacterium]
MRRRLALSFAAVTAMVVLAFVLPLGALIQRVAADRALNSARQAAATVGPVLAVEQDPTQWPGLIELLRGTSSQQLSVILPDATVLGAPTDIDDNVELARRGQAFTVDTAAGKALYLPVVERDGVLVVRAFVPNSQLRQGVAASWAMLAALALTLMVVAVAVGDRLGRSLVRPIRDLAAVAGELGEGNLSARVVPSGPPELLEVGHAQNRLAARIVMLLAQEREAVADLSHRLRTPITALRLDADTLQDPEESARIAAGVDSLTRTVTTIIAEARRTDRHDPTRYTDLAETTRQRVSFWSALAEEEGRPFQVDTPELPCPVRVGSEDLVAVLDALLGNVLAHTPPGTAFRVTVQRSPDAPTRLVVSDDGPGLAESSVERGVSGAGSSGLGLDIARRTVESAGGRLVVGRSASGGARISLEFPTGS